MNEFKGRKKDKRRMELSQQLSTMGCIHLDNLFIEDVRPQSLPPGRTKVRKLIRAFPAHSESIYHYVTPAVHRICESICAACIEARGSSEARQP